MARSRESKIELTAYDDLFQTDESREEAKLSKIRDIPIAEIDEFPDHPFKVLMDEDMEQLVDSIRRNGVMTPATVRLKEDGRYELISGHRRKKACELAGLDTLKCEVKELTLDEAIIVMVESNLQRSTILPSEKAFAYKTKPAFITIKPEDMKIDLWREFMKRIEKIMSTMVLSIYTLKKEVDLISLKLKKYDEGKIDVAQLLGFEENNIVTVIEIISLLHANKDKYDKTKSFNSNLPIILNLRGDTIGRTIEDKEKFIKTLVERDKSKTLSEYIWQGIFTFQEIYGYEMKLINQE